MERIYHLHIRDGAYFESQVNNVCFHNEFSRDKVTRVCVCVCVNVMERNIRIAQEIIPSRTKCVLALFFCWFMCGKDADDIFGVIRSTQDV